MRFCLHCVILSPYLFISTAFGNNHCFHSSITVIRHFLLIPYLSPYVLAFLFPLSPVSPLSFFLFSCCYLCSSSSLYHLLYVVSTMGPIFVRLFSFFITSCLPSRKPAVFNEVVSLTDIFCHRMFKMGQYIAPFSSFSVFRFLT